MNIVAAETKIISYNDDWDDCEDLLLSELQFVLREQFLCDRRVCRVIIILFINLYCFSL